MAGKRTVRKRAPGGGRKPQGEFAGKSASLTTRITPELRAALQREADLHERSVSQEAEALMREALELPEKLRQKWGPTHVQALARLVVLAVERVEASTRRKWHTDPFTGQAARAAISILLQHLVPEPEGTLERPEEVERSAQATARVLPGRLDFYRQPEGVAEPIALGLLTQLEAHETAPPLNYPRNERYENAYFEMPRLRQALGFKSNKDRQEP